MCHGVQSLREYTISKDNLWTRTMVRKAESETVYVKIARQKRTAVIILILFRKDQLSPVSILFFAITFLWWNKIKLCIT